VAFDALGNYYVTDTGNGRVLKLSPSGVPLAEFGGRGETPGKFHEPKGIVFHPEAGVLVADHRQGRVQVFTPQGEFRQLWTLPVPPSGLALPTYLELDADGNVYVSDIEANTIYLYTPQGQLLRQYAGSTPLRQPMGLACGPEALYVVEYGANRLRQIPYGQFSEVGEAPTPLPSPSAAPGDTPAR
jgi:DNA-binding beta-propeller fold protein YncE